MKELAADRNDLFWLIFLKWFKQKAEGSIFLEISRYSYQISTLLPWRPGHSVKAVLLHAKGEKQANQMDYEIKTKQRCSLKLFSYFRLQSTYALTPDYIFTAPSPLRLCPFELHHTSHLSKMSNQACCFHGFPLPGYQVPFLAWHSKGPLWLGSCPYL